MLAGAGEYDGTHLKEIASLLKFMDKESLMSVVIQTSIFIERELLLLHDRAVILERKTLFIPLQQRPNKQ